jgi:hypothetical protein
MACFRLHGGPSSGDPRVIHIPIIYALPGKRQAASVFFWIIIPLEQVSFFCVMPAQAGIPCAKRLFYKSRPCGLGRDSGGMTGCMLQSG